MKNLNTTLSHPGSSIHLLDETKINLKKPWSTPALLSLDGKKTTVGNTSGLYESAVVGEGLYASVVS
jgi:hypothetical protein